MAISSSGSSDGAGVDLFELVRCGQNEKVVAALHRGEPTPKLKEKDGWTLLHEAAFWGNKDLVLFVANFCDPSAENEDGLTAMHAAVERGHADVVTSLVMECGTDLLQGSEHAKNTPLMLAARRGRLEVCRALVERCGADINYRNKNQETALHVAVSVGSTETALGIMDLGVDLDATNDVGRTALHIAVARRNAAVVDALLRRFARVDTKDSTGKLPTDLKTSDDVRALLRRPVLHTCALNGQLERIKESVANEGVDVNATDMDGRSILFNAVSEGHYDLVEWLLHHGAVVEMKDKDGVRPTDLCREKRMRELLSLEPIHIAVMDGRQEIVRFLIDEHGGNPSVMDLLRRTPASYAAERGDTEILRILRRAGGDVSAPDKEDRAPLFYAAVGGHLEAAVELVRAGASPLREDGRFRRVEWYLRGMPGTESVREFLLLDEKIRSLDEHIRRPENIYDSVSREQLFQALRRHPDYKSHGEKPLDDPRGLFQRAREVIIEATEAGGSYRSWEMRGDMHHERRELKEADLCWEEAADRIQPRLLPESMVRQDFKPYDLRPPPPPEDQDETASAGNGEGEEGSAVEGVPEQLGTVPSTPPPPSPAELKSRWMSMGDLPPKPKRPPPKPRRDLSPEQRVEEKAKVTEKAVDDVAKSSVKDLRRRLGMV